jgi:FtsP/CotA-like multicopper oxidase with cupredoxin domain
MMVPQHGRQDRLGKVHKQEWDYTLFGSSRTAAERDHVFDMVFTKEDVADGGFNRWAINGRAYPNTMEMVEPILRLTLDRRCILRISNDSDDIHPIHLHRHSFELTRIAGKQSGGVIKDVVLPGGYQQVELDFIAYNAGPTLFHCH